MRGSWSFEASGLAKLTVVQHRSDLCSSDRGFSPGRTYAGAVNNHWLSRDAARRKLSGRQ